MPKTAAAKGTKKGEAATVVVRLNATEQLLRRSAIDAETRAAGPTQTVSLTNLDRESLAIGYQAIADGKHRLPQAAA